MLNSTPIKSNLPQVPASRHNLSDPKSMSELPTTRNSRTISPRKDFFSNFTSHSPNEANKVLFPISTQKQNNIQLTYGTKRSANNAFQSHNSHENNSTILTNYFGAVSSTRSISSEFKNENIQSTKRVKFEGMRNLGNTCYMSAVMQALLGLKGFVMDLLSPFWIDVLNKPKQTIVIMDSETIELKKLVNNSCLRQITSLAR